VLSERRGNDRHLGEFDQSPTAISGSRYDCDPPFHFAPPPTGGHLWILQPHAKPADYDLADDPCRSQARKSTDAVSDPMTPADRDRFRRAMVEQLSIDQARTAVVTVDMQRQYLDMDVGGQRVAPGEAVRVLENSERFLALARVYGIPVIHAYVSRRPAELEARSSISPFKRTADDLGLSQLADMPVRQVADRIEGSPQSEVPAQLVADGDIHVTTKKTYDGFLGTELNYLLSRVFGAETVILMGINTDTCVFSTAFSSANLGFRTVVLSSCTASMRGVDSHAMALELMSRSFAWVLTAGELEQVLFGVVPRY